MTEVPFEYLEILAAVAEHGRLAETDPDLAAEEDRILGMTRAEFDAIRDTFGKEALYGMLYGGKFPEPAGEAPSAPAQAHTAGTGRFTMVGWDLARDGSLAPTLNLWDTIPVYVPVVTGAAAWLAQGQKPSPSYPTMRDVLAEKQAEARDRARRLDPGRGSRSRPKPPR